MGETPLSITHMASQTLTAVVCSKSTLDRPMERGPGRRTQKTEEEIIERTISDLGTESHGQLKEAIVKEVVTTDSSEVKQDNRKPF